MNQVRIDCVNLLVILEQMLVTFQNFPTTNKTPFQQVNKCFF